MAEKNLFRFLKINVVNNLTAILKEILLMLTKKMVFIVALFLIFFSSETKTTRL